MASKPFSQRRSVDLTPQTAASRVVRIHGQLAQSHVLSPIDWHTLQAEKTALWDEYFPGYAYEDIAALVPSFLIAA